VIAPEELVGEWTIERSLTDLRTSMHGRFTGTLLVSADGAGCGWHESGTLLWGDYTGTAERHLLMRRLDGAWWMCFADGRPFHPWQVGVEVVHPCRADVYRGRIEPRGADEFEITWDVSGPDKRQLIVSRMRRQAWPADSPADSPAASTAAATTSTPSTWAARANAR
jgi:hypothetical protein